MKKLYFYIATGFIIMAGATSCKKIDALSPHDAIPLGSAFQSIQDAQKWDAGTYSALRGNFDMSHNTTDIQADELSVSLSEGNANGGQYRWGAFFSADSPSGYWEGWYAAIANIDAAITGFPSITTGDAADAASLKQYTGDLYLARAYYYDRLILRYGKSYNPTTAATDPGVPLVLTYNVSAKPARATVKQVYTQILSDITTAEGLLAGIPGQQGAIVFNIDVATALEARVRLDMQDWSGAYTAANKLITPGVYPLINTLAGFQSYWTNDGSQEDIYQSFTNTTTEQPSGSYPYLNYTASLSADNPSYIPTFSIIGMYQNTDIRKATYFANEAVDISGVTGNLILINKYPGNPIFYTGSTVSTYQNAPKAFRIAEMYLIAAEAAANNSDAAAALTALNTLHQARCGTTYTGLSGTALTDTIRSERTRELAFEGFRLDDLERWGTGFTRSGPQNTSFLLTGPSTVNLSIPAGDYQFIWAIPSNDLTLNPNLTQNPGW
jgi:hypothetical protein